MLSQPWAPNSSYTHILYFTYICSAAMTRLFQCLWTLSTLRECGSVQRATSHRRLPPFTQLTICFRTVEEIDNRGQTNKCIATPAWRRKSFNSAARVAVPAVATITSNSCRKVCSCDIALWVRRSAWLRQQSGPARVLLWILVKLTINLFN